MADQPTLAELLQKPTMPEAHDIKEPAGLKYMRAFGAGLIDPLPFGLTEMAAKALAERGMLPANFDLKARRLREMQAEAPITAGAASALIPGIGGGRLAGATLKEATNPAMIASMMQVGGGLAGLKDILLEPGPPKRAQGSYQPGGAY